MSKGRLLDIKSELESLNLKIMLPGETKNCFEVENELVRWFVMNSETGKTIELQFHLFDDLGRPTSKLTDILYVVIIGHNIKFYFERRHLEQWRTNLAEFAIKVNSVLAL